MIIYAPNYSVLNTAPDCVEQVDAGLGRQRREESEHRSDQDSHPEEPFS